MGKKYALVKFAPYNFKDADNPEAETAFSVVKFRRAVGLMSLLQKHNIINLVCAYF